MFNVRFSFIRVQKYLFSKVEYLSHSLEFFRRGLGNITHFPMFISPTETQRIKSALVRYCVIKLYQQVFVKHRSVCFHNSRHSYRYSSVNSWITRLHCRSTMSGCSAAFNEVSILLISLEALLIVIKHYSISYLQSLIRYDTRSQKSGTRDDWSH